MVPQQFLLHLPVGLQQLLPAARVLLAHDRLCALQRVARAIGRLVHHVVQQEVAHRDV